MVDTQHQVLERVHAPRLEQLQRDVLPFRYPDERVQRYDRE